MTNQVLVITGMHRSGTSLTASLLQSAGLDVGQRLLMENESNPKGHYEDLDFVNFHEDILDAQGLNTAGWTLDRSIPISEILLPQAMNLVEKNNSKPLWGWKDPRTVLFLDFWQKLIPEAKFLFIYRQPWEVMDSLFRRGNLTFVKNPNLALEVWQHYNQLILEFCQTFPERSLLLSLDSVIQDPVNLIKGIQEKLGITLEMPEGDRYDQSLLKREASHHPLLIQTYFPEAIELYTQLCNHSLAPNLDLNIDLNINSCTSLYLPLPPSTSSYKPWVAKDWVDYANMERHRNGLEVEITKIHGQMIEAMAEIAQAHAEVSQTHAYAHAEIIKANDIFQEAQAALQHQLELTQQELADANISHQHTQQHLLTTQQELGKVQTELERLRGILRGMESSKFWLMRRVWIKLKRVLGSKQR